MVAPYMHDCIESLSIVCVWGALVTIVYTLSVASYIYDILHDEKENGCAVSYLTLCMHYGSVVQDHTLQLKPNNLALQRYHNDTYSGIILIAIEINIETQNLVI